MLNRAAANIEIDEYLMKLHIDAVFRSDTNSYSIVSK